MMRRAVRYGSNKEGVLCRAADFCPRLVRASAFCPDLIGMPAHYMR